MSLAAFKAWVLALFLLAQPTAPWSATYEASADTIARAALASPVFGGADGPAKTAAMLVSLGWFEGALKPDAAGDCHERRADGTCKAGATPHSWCMMQVHESNFAALGVTRDQIVGDFDACVDAALRMVRISMGVCRGRPVDDLLGQYASGGGECGGLVQSKHRMRKAFWLLRTRPAPLPEL